MKKVQGCICWCVLMPLQLYILHVQFTFCFCHLLVSKFFYEWVSTERVELLTFLEFLSLQFKHDLSCIHPSPSTVWVYYELTKDQL